MRERIDVNLASAPFRNRRLFAFLAGTLLVLIVLLGLLSAVLTVHYDVRSREVKRALRDVENKLDELRSQEAALRSQVAAETEALQAEVETANSLIFQKSFTWSGFLSDLESLLPDSCFIVSLVPTLKENSRMEVRVRLSSGGLDGLLEFINRLQNGKFGSVRVISESRSEAGRLLSDVSFIYEKKE